MAFPIKLIGTFDEIWGRAIREGVHTNVELNNTAAIVPVSGSVLVAEYVNIPTEHLLIDAINLSASGQCYIQAIYSSGPNNGTSSVRHLLKSNTMSVPMKSISYAGGVFSVSARNGDGTTALALSASLSATRITADLNFNADKVIMWIGDSIVRGSSMGGTNGTVTPEDHFAFQVRNHFQSRGIDCRLVLKAMGGQKSTDMEYWRKQGWFNIQQADVIFYQLGVNDIAATTPTQFEAVLNEIVSWRDRVFPKSKLVFVGDTPLNPNGSETPLVALRAKKQLVASQNANKNVYYLTLENAFDRTVLSNYTANDGTHPNIASNLLIGNTIKAWINANNFTF